jgi:hypothetical protein
MSIIHKYHPEYGPAMLCSRSLVHQLRTLFAAPPELLKLAKLQSKLDQMSRQVPERVSGRHMFLTDCYAAVASQSPAGGRLSDSMRRKVFQRHVELYASLSLQEKEVYEARANRFGSAKRQKLSDDHVHLLSHLGLQRRRLKEEQEDIGIPCLLSNCRFSSADLDVMAVMWEDPLLSVARLRVLKQRLLLAPEVPEEVDQVLLSSFPVQTYGARAEEPVPDWAANVCRHRASFFGCVFVGQSLGSEKSYLMLYAIQRPFLLALVPLVRVHRTWPTTLHMSVPELLQLQAGFPEHEFQLDWGFSMLEADPATLEAGSIKVLPDVFHTKDGRVCSHAHLILMEDFLEDLSKNPLPKPPKKPKLPSSQVDPELLKQHPWLRSYSRRPVVINADEEAPLEEAASSSTLVVEVGGEGESSEDETDEGDEVGSDVASRTMDEVDEEAIQQALLALAAKRAAWADDPKVHAVDFETHIRGGAWTQQVKGLAFDCIIARPCSEVGASFCKEYGLQKTVSYSFKKYGEVAASQLALAWAHKMQFFRCVQGFLYTRLCLHSI